MKNHQEQHTPLVVDLTATNSSSSLVLKQLSPEPDTILMVKAEDHEAAKDYLEAALNPCELKPGKINILRPQAPGRWWVFGLFL